MTKLWLLGTGTPVPCAQRWGNASLLQIVNEHVLVDCGPATSYKLLKVGVLPTQVDHLLFTHNHSDHNSDYPCFLLHRWDQSTGHENQLSVWGPEPLSLITDRLIGPEGAFACDIEARVNHPSSLSAHRNRGGSLPRPRPQVNVTELQPGQVIEQPNWRVRVAEAQHMEPWLISLAYRFDTDDCSMVFAGDTQPCDTLAELAAGTDVLVANCNSHQATMDEDGTALGQTGTIRAAEMALQAGAKTLILTHARPNFAEPGSRERGIADIGAIYDGRIIWGEELMQVDLSKLTA